MNRRKVLLGLLATVPATPGLASAVIDHVSGHWLDSVSSQDIESAVKQMPDGDEIWRQFRLSLGRLRRRSQARRRREQRTDNIVLWRGIVTDDLPTEITERLSEVKSARRDVLIAHVNAPFVWQGETLYPGSTVLVDSRLTSGIAGALGEVIETPHKGRRLHIWPASRALALVSETE
jgi:hypothetical protein